MYMYMYTMDMHTLAPTILLHFTSVINIIMQNVWVKELYIHVMHSDGYLRGYCGKIITFFVTTVGLAFPLSPLATLVPFGLLTNKVVLSYEHQLSACQIAGV